MLATQLDSYLLISAILFVLGTYTVLTRRNLLAMLMGIELILNACALNFVAFSRFRAEHFIDGQVFTLFIIVLAAAEALVAFAIAVSVYKNFKAIKADEANQLRG